MRQRRLRPRGRSRGSTIGPHCTSIVRLILSPAASNNARTAPRGNVRSLVTLNHMLVPLLRRGLDGRELHGLGAHVDLARHLRPVGIGTGPQRAHAILNRQFAAAPGHSERERPFVREDQQAVLTVAERVDRDPAARVQRRQVHLDPFAFVARAAPQHLARRACDTG